MLPGLQKATLNLIGIIHHHATASNRDTMVRQLLTQISEMRIFADTDEELVSKIDDFD